MQKLRDQIATLERQLTAARGASFVSELYSQNKIDAGKAVNFGALLSRLGLLAEACVAIVITPPAPSSNIARPFSASGTTKPLKILECHQRIDALEKENAELRARLSKPTATPSAPTPTPNAGGEAAKLWAEYRALPTAQARREFWNKHREILRRPANYE